MEQESRMVEGYAALFDTMSADMGFREVILPGAFDGVLGREDLDVLCLMNHDERRGVLARHRNGGGTLSLSIDERGLIYRFDAPNTALGDELLEGLKRGDISQSSFAFSVAEEAWEKQSDETWVRKIVRFDNLYDVSPVYQPAYPDTTVAKRSLEEKQLEEEIAAEEAERAAEEERQRAQKEAEKAELTQYFNDLKAKIDELT